MSTARETVRVQKYHGTGNDFLIVDDDTTVYDRRAFAERHCDREAGLDDPNAVRRGADGVLFLDLTTRFSPPRIVMTLVQPDGSVAAMCGNGARCAAAWAHEQTGHEEFMIDTPAGTRHAAIEPDRITIEMGTPAFDPSSVPLASDREAPLVEEPVEELTVTAVNTGVPHAVAFVEAVDSIDLANVAPPIRHASVFPQGANVTIASPKDPDRPEAGYDQRTFERGVEGETRSCGTGAVAIVAAARETDRLDADSPVTVSPPGGDLEIAVHDRGPATLSGPVEHEFEARAAVEPDPVEDRSATHDRDRSQ